MSEPYIYFFACSNVITDVYPRGFATHIRISFFFFFFFFCVCLCVVKLRGIMSIRPSQIGGSVQFLFRPLDGLMETQAK